MSTRSIRANDSLDLAVDDVYRIANGDPLALDFTNLLDGNTIASVNSLTISPSTGLTLENEARNSSEYTDDDGNTVAVNSAVLFDKAAGSSVGDYVVRIIVTLSNGSQRDGEISLSVQ